MDPAALSIAIAKAKAKALALSSASSGAAPVLMPTPPPTAMSMPTGVQRVAATFDLCAVSGAARNELVGGRKLQELAQTAGCGFSVAGTYKAPGQPDAFPLEKGLHVKVDAPNQEKADFALSLLGRAAQDISRVQTFQLSHQQTLPSAPVLENGWAEARTPEGKVYYWHKPTGATRWDPPLASLPPPPPPPPPPIVHAAQPQGFPVGVPAPQGYGQPPMLQPSPHSTMPQWAPQPSAYAPPPLQYSAPKLAPAKLEHRQFVGLAHRRGLKEDVCGPDNSYLLHVSTSTGCTVSLHGRGSGTLETIGTKVEESPEPLHIMIRAPSVEALDRARDLCVSLVERIRALELERLLQPQDKRSDHATTGNKGAGNGAAPTPPAGPPPSSRDAPKHDQEEEQPPKRRRRGFREAEEYTEPPVVAVNLERAPAAAVPPLEPVPPPAMPMKKPEVPPFSDAAPLQGSASGGTASSASFGMAPPAPRQPASSSSSSMMPPPPRKTNSSMAPPPPMLPRKAAASAMGPPPSAAKPPVESKGETSDKTGAVQGLVAYGDEEDSN